MPLDCVLGVEGLSAGYDGRPALDDVTFDVREGDILGIVGPNGAGKTTMFRAMLGLHPYSGTIRLFGSDARESGHLMPLVGYVQQKVAFEPNFPATVREVVAMGIIPERRLARGDRTIRELGFARKRIYGGIAGDGERADAALGTVGLGHLRDRRIGGLSGGELQRVFIAQSLVKDPALLILDEPVTSIDAESQARFYEIVRRINEENGITIVWSSHDLDAISRHASCVACMNCRLSFHGGKDEFFSDESLLRTYTESSMQAHMRGHGVDGN